MTERRPLIAGNWKMNLNLQASAALVKDISDQIAGIDDVDVLVAPPFTSIPLVKQAIGNGRIFLAAQNMHWEASGAYTGEISADMLLEAGCTHVILGHSERRSDFKETDEMVNLKAQAALEQGLLPIICLGEALEDREADRTFEVIEQQLEGSLKGFREKADLPPSVVIAYEPIWAIGTGKTATPEQAQEVHHFIRNWMKGRFNESTASAVRILYGGSVKPDNALDLMSRPDIDGALVGGASLKPELFVPIIKFKE
jgi:triosephosphate isomerase (TIM)